MRCCIRRISWFRAQDVCIHLAHDVVLLFSNTAWFLSSVVVHVCGNHVGNVDMSSVSTITVSASELSLSFTWLTLRWSVGSVLKLSVSTQTVAHGVRRPLPCGGLRFPTARGCSESCNGNNPKGL